MKKVVCAALAAIALSALPAEAQQPTGAPLFNWTGCYVGAQAGYSWGDVDAPDNGVAATPPASARPKGPDWGGRLGCDISLTPNFVVGIHGEFSYSSADGSRFVDHGLGSTNFETRLKSYSSATGRMGYADGPWLIYGKGGFAWASNQFHHFINAGGTILNFGGEDTLKGWTAGAGVEYRIAKNWTLFTEYGYYNFGTQSVAVAGTITVGGVLQPPISDTAQYKQNFSVVKIGATYRFGAN